VTVAVSVDGQQSTTVVADGTRTDVGRVYPQAGAQHGYAAQVRVGLGTHQVCASAIDTSFATSRATLRCGTVTVTPGLPFGSLDGVHVDSSGVLTLSGWAIDPDTPTTPTTIVIYLDGHWASTLANGTRTDVGRVYPQAGAQHGYARSFQVAAGVAHKVCTYALDTSFPTLHTGLRCLTTS
jgi:hypothetical protein